jgi:hypothetical protein
MAFQDEHVGEIDLQLAIRASEDFVGILHKVLVGRKAIAE